MSQMMKLRLHREGLKRNPIWHIIAQHSSKHWDGRNYNEKLGIWYHREKKTVDRSLVLNKHKIRFWIGNGAQPTNSVYKLLVKANMLPKPPIPFGEKYFYQKDPIKLNMKHFEKLPWGFKDLENYQKEDINDSDFYIKHGIIINSQFNNDKYYTGLPVLTQQMQNYIINNLDELKKLVENSEGVNELYPGKISDKSYSIKQILPSDCDTDLIDSDEKDFLLRKRNFYIINKKLRNHITNKFPIYKGKDLEFHTYTRKIQKIAKNHGIDEFSYNKFNELVEIERQKNDILKKRLSLRFQREYENSKEYKTLFYDLFNKGVVDEKAFEEFASKQVSEIQKMFNIQIDNYFKRKGEEDELGSLFGKNPKYKEIIEDYACLRFAKLIKKLKEGYIYSISEKNDSTNIETLANKMKTDYFKVNTTSIIDNSIISVATEKFEKDRGLHSLFYSKVNSALISSSTFKKFKDRLAIKDDIYLINDQLIEGLCSELEEILSKNFEMNDIYNDKEKSNKVDVKRSKELNEKIQMLKEKYSIDIDLKSSKIDKVEYTTTNKELKDEISKLKDEYKFEIVENSKLEEKFKQSFRIYLINLQDKQVILEKKKEENNSENNDKPRVIAGDMKESREIFVKNYNKAIQDIRMEKIGEKKPYVPINSTEDWEYRLARRQVEADLFGNSLSFYQYEGLYFDVGVFKDKGQPLVKGVHSSNPKKQYNPKEGARVSKAMRDDIVALNNKHLFSKFNFQKSMLKSYKIHPYKLKYMMSRFEEYFGSSDEYIYPEGFKHLRSFEEYQIIFPDKDINLYKNEGKFFI